MRNQLPSELIRREPNQIRKVFHDGRWFFAIIDFFAASSGISQAQRYWKTLRRRLAREGAQQTLQNIKQLGFSSADNKICSVDCSDIQTLLRIIQSIPSPKAEPFKQWLASLGADVIDDRTEDQRRLDYRQPKAAEAHKGLHAEIHQRGVRRRTDHAEFDARGHEALYDGESPRETEARRGIPPGEGPSWMGSEEMGDTIFRDVQSRAYIRRMDIQGKEPVMQAHEEVSHAVRAFIVEDLGGTPPEQLPKARKSLEQAGRDEERRRTKGMDLWPGLDSPDEPPATETPQGTAGSSTPDASDLG